MCITFYEFITHITPSQTTLEIRISKIDSKFEKRFAKTDFPKSSPKGPLIYVTFIMMCVTLYECITCIWCVSHFMSASHLYGCVWHFVGSSQTMCHTLWVHHISMEVCHTLWSHTHFTYTLYEFITYNVCHTLWVHHMYMDVCHTSWVHHIHNLWVHRIQCVSNFMSASHTSVSARRPLRIGVAAESASIIGVSTVCERETVSVRECVRAWQRQHYRR